MSLSETRGKHIAFYYCGTDHLVLNLTKYVEAGILNNELICIYCRDSIYQTFINFLKNNNTKNIIRFSAKPLIHVHKEGGIELLKEKIDSLIFDAKSKGYNGIRCIREGSLAIEETSKEDFLNYEKDINEALSGKDFSCICAYDFSDFMGGMGLIDKDIIDFSKISHTHQLYQFNLVSMFE